MPGLADLVAPYEFSPTVAVVCAGATALFVRGWLRLRRRGSAPAAWRVLCFITGVALIYAVLQTWLDYLSQHMFWIHRAQHLVLHHLGPLLVLLALPGPVLRAGLPVRLRRPLAVLPLPRGPMRAICRSLQHPILASVLFAGLVWYWLLPSVHFDAMLSIRQYKAMNWSMAVDGLLFWWLIVEPRRDAPGTPGYGTRVLMLWFVMLPQIAIGAWLSLTPHAIYSVYNVCGRAWPIGPLTDQQIGGLITWIPASMMSMLGALVVLRRWRAEADPQTAATRPSRGDGRAPAMHPLSGTDKG
ncbi:MAG TPA: cytochrome c oxidase assembly protein [Gammaproteobacteria bacterium]|nr:cytochrome c oxidase assembly protein [Gammaproteobacteria bacterium]